MMRANLNNARRNSPLLAVHVSVRNRSYLRPGATHIRAHGFIRWLREYRYGGNTANEVKTKKIDEEVMTSFIVEIRVVHHVYYKMRRKIKQMNGK